jgi:hypothetical protein
MNILYVYWDTNGRFLCDPCRNHITKPGRESQRGSRFRPYPLYYSLYINDAPVASEIHLAVFAGDSYIYATKKHECLVLCKLQRYIVRARCSIFCWGTMQQAWMLLFRFPVRSLDFLIYLILTVALWPWDCLSLLTEMSTRNFPGG